MAGDPLTAKARAVAAVELVVAGEAVTDICDALGMSRMDVNRAVDVYLKQVPNRIQSDVENLRKIESARLDALQAAQWNAAMSGDTDAAKTVLAIMKHRADILGLAAPKRVDLSVTSAIDAEIYALMETLSAARPKMIEAEVVEG